MARSGSFQLGFAAGGDAEACCNQILAVNPILSIKIPIFIRQLSTKKFRISSWGNYVLPGVPLIHHRQTGICRRSTGHLWVLIINEFTYVNLLIISSNWPLAHSKFSIRSLSTWTPRTNRVWGPLYWSPHVQVSPHMISVMLWSRRLSSYSELSFKRRHRSRLIRWWSVWHSLQELGRVHWWIPTRYCTRQWRRCANARSGLWSTLTLPTIHSPPPPTRFEQTFVQMSLSAGRSRREVWCLFSDGDL